MNSSTLLVILAVVVVCAVVFVLFSRSGKNKAAEKKADPAEASRYAQCAQDILKALVCTGDDGGAGLWQCVSMMPYAPKTGGNGRCFDKKEWTDE